MNITKPWKTLTSRQIILIILIIFISIYLIYKSSQPDFKKLLIITKKSGIVDYNYLHENWLTRIRAEIFNTDSEYCFYNLKVKVEYFNVAGKLLGNNKLIIDRHFKPLKTSSFRSDHNDDAPKDSYYIKWEIIDAEFEKHQH